MRNLKVRIVFQLFFFIIIIHSAAYSQFQKVGSNNHVINIQGRQNSLGKSVVFLLSGCYENAELFLLRNGDIIRGLSKLKMYLHQ